MVLTWRGKLAILKVNMNSVKTRVRQKFENRIADDCAWMRQPSFFYIWGGVMARKNKYDLYVKPNLPRIKEWVKSGATEKEICTALGIAVSTFNVYKNEHSELSDALREGRQTIVLDIKAALFKRAMGFEYEEKKGVKKDGELVSMEVNIKYYPPDTTAAAMLLRNYDKEWRDKDAAMNEFKAQELEIKKALAEAQNFDVKFD